MGLLVRVVVTILARENPIGLITLVGALHATAGGTNDIRYIVRYDHDDVDSLRAIMLLQDDIPNVVGLPGERPLTLGAAWNEALRAGGDWEVAATFPNDVVPMCDQWDSILAGFLKPKEHPGCSWWQTCDPAAPVFPAICRQWFDALDQRLFPEWFPFWFSDTWVVEVSNLAFGTRLPIIKNLQLGGKHEATNGMRDLAWWFSFFAKTRVLRIQEAKRLAEALGWPTKDMHQALTEMERSDKWQQGRVPLYEQVFKANVGEPSERYLIAKQRAEDWMAAHAEENM